MIKFRIVPVVKSTGMFYIVERKSFIFWNICKQKHNSIAGTVYETLYFVSTQTAVNYIKEHYGQYPHIEYYRC